MFTILWPVQDMLCYKYYYKSNQLKCTVLEPVNYYYHVIFEKPKLKSAMQFLARIWFREPEVLFYRGKHWCGWGISLHIHTSLMRSHFVKKYKYSSVQISKQFIACLLLVPLDSSCISTKVYILFVNTFLLIAYRPKGISVFSPCIQ